MRVKMNSTKALAFTLCVMICISLFLCGQSVFANEETVGLDPKTGNEVEKQENTETVKEEKNKEISKKEEAVSSTEKTEGALDFEKKTIKTFKAPALRAEQNNVIKRIEALLQDGSGPVGENIGQWQIFRIKAYFELPDRTVKAGDTTTIKLPEKLRFDQVVPFTVKTADGEVVANAVVDGQNKTLTLTYTDYPETHSDVNGSFYFYVRMDRKLVDGEEDIPLDFIINNQVLSAGKVHFEGYPTPQGGIVGKSGTQESTVSGSRAWFAVNVNTKGEDLKDVMIIDTLKSPGITIDKSTITIQKGTWKVVKGDYDFQNGVDVTNQQNINWNEDDSGFSVSLGDVGPEEGYRIRYYIDSEYELIDGESIDNNIILHAKDIQEQSHDAKITWLVAGGAAEGYVYKIRINKVEKGNEQNKLAGAVFEVKRVANNDVVGTITTGADGEGELGGLLKDKYELTEVTPPEGYEPLLGPVIVDAEDFNSEKIATKTIENEPIIPETVEITVKKVWVGKPTEGGIITLTRDNETVESINIGTEEGWSYTFDNLPKTDPLDGHDYIYDVIESGLDGSYISKKENPSVGTYIFTNRITGTVDIPVKKEWIGPEKEQATIRLMRSEEVIDTVILSLDNEWKHIFRGLDKYDDNGQEIVYEIKEEKISGYETDIRGDMSNGFVVTNTIIGKVSVPVTKVWDGPRLESVTIDLLANGKKVDSIKLSKNNNWQYTFKDLDEYSNGEKITYTVRETDIANYKSNVSGNAQSGYLIRNTNTETRNVDVSKKWVGGSKRSVVIRLYADGKETDLVKLDSTRGWKYTFTNLRKFASDGSEIKYTITEDAVKGYSSEITGNSDKGYTVKNTKIKTPSDKERIKPAKKIKTSPRTGDGMIIYGWVIAIAAALAIIAAILRRRNKAN